eukprot:gene38167-50054_t
MAERKWSGKRGYHPSGSNCPAQEPTKAGDKKTTLSFAIFTEHKLLVRQRKRKAITTDSRHWMRKYSNLIKDISVTRPEQVW